MVFVFVHLQEIIMYFVGQVISKIGIGKNLRMVSDDIARHLERGVRLVCLFAELGNFFPARRYANLRSLIVLPDRFASIYDFAVMR